ncbi:hypothetical protein BSKO_08569 [Bryopsis sp. KO-2023]|nr:hypothetical protein BSKO_08569 [Bryopsis sp. KO-2023]
MSFVAQNSRLVPGLCRCTFPYRFLNGAVLPSASSRHVVRACATRNVAASASVDVSTKKTPAEGGAQGFENGSGPAPTFQEAIAKLQEYWGAVGCTVWMPHNTEVGAGTMNPATFLRALGPEPWNVCYPEPSVRPDDSRYGDNPNRVQKHTQFQVILKPDPGNPQELYLGSLAALGITSGAHDIRFVEDNWEAPVLGAWGLGWEVWMDGMEVTQFTYFQQVGGRPLPVPAIEITYGLERILMALQGVDHFKKIRYNQHLTYGELFLQNEFEMSKYNLEEAVVESQWKRFQLYEEEAKLMLEKGLPIPAYENLLKCSHSFNLLDARGAVGVTERNTCFAKLRTLAREIAVCWVARREELGFPLGNATESTSSEKKIAAVPMASNLDPRTFVLEIGSEELPPVEVVSAISQLKTKFPEMLREMRLDHGSIAVHGTPRRVAVVIEGLAGKQKLLEEKVRGPPAKIAFDDSGEPSKALLGFCKKNNISADSVTKEADAKGVEYVYAMVRDEGKSAAEVLAGSLPKLLSTISFRKSMRWNSNVTWSRPLRWLVAMHGVTEIPLEFAGMTAGSSSCLLRGGSPGEVRLASAEEYVSTMDSNAIIVNMEARKAKIWDEVQNIAKEHNGVVPESFGGDLLNEVANLVEAPTVISGTFSEEFLNLPTDVLVSVMQKHQRYFPVVSQDDPDELMPVFITVANGQIDVDTVRSGNEAVLRARFQDAEFFYNEDLKEHLETFRPKLDGTTFEKSLGSLLEKTVRIEKLVRPLGYETGLKHMESLAKRAARLCRADLATSMVTEMTSLAGTMGRHYALFWGESPDVAQAIFESVLPRFSGDILPATHAGIVVSLADKIDSLVGLVAAGRAPTATADPYALRRTAYGFLQTLIVNQVSLDVVEAVDLASYSQKIKVTTKAKEEVLTFIQRRLEQLLVDRGLPIQAVRSVLLERGNDPYLASASAEDLSRQLENGEESLLARVMTPMARPIRIVRGKEIPQNAKVDETLFEHEEERALLAAYKNAAEKVNPSMSIPEFLKVCESLAGPIDQYFDKVFVMSDDEAIKTSRLALLQKIADLPTGILEFSELPGF